MNVAEQYAQDVLKEKVVVGSLIRDTVKRYYRDLDAALDKGWYLDREAGMRAIKFIERLKHTKGEFAGKNLLLEPWQQFIVFNIFAWKRADGTRRFRYAYIEVARKNGKTTLAAGISLYMLFGDKENRAEVYSVATTSDQARITFRDTVEIVRNTSLKSRLSIFRNSISYEKTASYFKPLSSDAGVHDGYSPSCTIIDEYHAHKTNDMFDVMKSGMGARRQPLMFIITTAGFNKNGPCYSYHKNAINVVRNIAQDDSLFVAIFSLDQEDSWEDETVWVKANPNLGISVYPDFLREQMVDAKNRPEAVRNVKTKNFNQWVDADITWILDEKWMLCVDGYRAEDLIGKKCWGGLDLGSVSDITAMALIFHEDERYQLLLRCWIPEDSLQDHIRKGHIDFQRWVDEGYMIMTPGNVTDYEFIEQDIYTWRDTYQIQSVSYDRWNSTQTIIHLSDEGLEMNPIGQGFGSLSAPTKELERIVLSRLLCHFGNPVLRWMMASVALKRDPAGNIKPDKDKATQKIDGVVASIMALAQLMTSLAEADKNPYENRGLSTL